MVSLKNMFSGLKKQVRHAFVPKARLHMKGDSAVVYRRWFGIDINVSEKSSARLLPSLLREEAIRPAAPKPHSAPLTRRPRVISRRSLGLDLLRQAQISPLDLITQSARQALAAGAANLEWNESAHVASESAAKLRGSKIALVSLKIEGAKEGQNAIMSDSLSLSELEQRYLTQMRLKTTYGGTPEVYALSQLLKKTITVYELTGEGGLKKRLVFAPENTNGEIAVRLRHMGSAGAHYDPILERINQDFLAPSEAEKVQVRSVAGDGQCLWNAIGELVAQQPDALRQHTVDYLLKHARDRPAFLGGARALLADAADS